MNFERLTNLAHHQNEIFKAVEESFGYPQGYSFEKDFLLLADPSNHANYYVAHNNIEVCAGMGINLRTLQWNDQSFKCVLIGGVFTKEAYRRKGLFKSLLSAIHQEWHDQADCFMLWSDATNLYRKYGYANFGLQFQVHGIASTRRGIAPSKLNAEQREKWKRLYTAQVEKWGGFQRDSKVWQLLFKHESMEYFDIGEHYLIRGKGADLQNTVHETSLDPTNPEHVEIAKRYGNLWVPVSTQEYGVNCNAQYIGMFRPANGPGAKRLLKELQISSIHDNPDSFQRELDQQLGVFELSPLWISGADSI